MQRLRNYDIFARKIYNQLFLLRWKSGQCVMYYALHFDCYAIKSCKKKSDILFLYIKIVGHSGYKIINFSN